MFIYKFIQGLNMAMRARIRKWGNSFGIMIPGAFLKEKDLNLNEEVFVEVNKRKNIEKLFGICHFKRSTKSIMKEIKEGYDT